MAELIIRETAEEDVEACFSVRARTRDNPIPPDQLARVGITPQSIISSLRSGAMKGWVCSDGQEIIGFCTAEAPTGEVLVLAVLPEYEGRGVGRRLLARAVRWLNGRGVKRPWLAASADPADRSHGFYRALGWTPTGERQDNGDEVLILHTVEHPAP
jgi:GNAT superfamily N-acetyltransferase